MSKRGPQVSFGPPVAQKADIYKEANEFCNKQEKADWITNLRRDASSFLVLNKGRTPVKELYSYEDMEKKLEGLKALYDKKLITETQYQLKQKEIMSRY